MKPHQAKSRIFVIRNQEDRVFEKSKRFAPVLSSDSLRILTAQAVEKRRVLLQVDFKNNFCNATLPNNEITIGKPPYGEPNAKPGELWLLKKTLYGLRRIPQHWYDMVTGILKDMGLTASCHDPCLFSGTTNDDSAPETAHKPVYVGL